jgi:hypothetical protein
MSNRNVTIFRNIGLGLILFFGIISCEKDLEDIAVDLAGEKPFSVGDSLLEIITYNVNIDSSRVDNNDFLKQPLSLLGVDQNANFGNLKSALLSQLFLPNTGVDFGDNAVIDLVVLDIPYFATRDGEQDAVDPITGEPINDEDGNPLQVPNFELDSVYGNTSQEFNISVYELGTFLNVLDPLDPTKSKTYYSNKDFILLDNLFSDDFKINRNDTVLYVERRFLDDDPNTVDDIDTIKGANTSPSIKFNLDNQFFKERFIDHQNSSDFDSNDNFVSYFRGVYIDANGTDGSLINLSTTAAKMTIYYTNEEIIDEGETEDLNNNGVNGEENVLVKTKQSMNFTFGGVRTGKYTHDYSGSMVENALLNPDEINGESKLYIQGAGGSQGVIDLFTDENLEILRSKNWLINEANLTFYVDGDQSEVPDQLFLYNYEYNSLINDFFNPLFGPDFFGGKLEYDSDGKPEKYKFRITKYISDILDASDPKKPSKLTIKNYVTTDLPNFALLDTIVSDYNWIPKGVVLHGNLPKSNDKRIKLEIFYSK